MRPNRFWILLCIVAAACDDVEVLSPDLPPGCESPRACQVQGIDLVVEPPRLLLADDHPRDAQTGRAILMPGEAFAYEVTMWNRGDAASVATTLNVDEVEIAVPALAPGQLFVDTLDGAAPTDLGLRADTAALWAWRATRQAAEDPLHGNDESRSEPFIVALPVIQAELIFPDTVTAGSQFMATVTLNNTSRFAEFESGRMAFCLWDFDVGCGSWSGEPFGLTDVPAIAAGESWSADLLITIPLHEDYETWDWSLVACMGDADAALDDFRAGGSSTCVPSDRPIHVRETAANGGGES